MQKLLIYAAFYLCFPQLSAQDAYHSSLAAQFQSEHDLTGGQWVLPETATFTASSNYGAVVTNFSVSGQPFIQGRRFQVQAGQNPYASGHLYQNGQTITANNKCLMVIWLRSPTPDAQVNVFAENASSWPVGTYILTLANAGKQRTERFVVQH